MGLSTQEIKTKLAQHEIHLEESDYENVQRIFNMVQEAEKELEGNEALKQKTPLQIVDKEELQR